MSAHVGSWGQVRNLLKRYYLVSEKARNFIFVLSGNSVKHKLT